jgi:hypothetical protein
MDELEDQCKVVLLYYYRFSSVPDPDPPDPHVFGPPGSGSISQRYGSGSFHHQAKIVRKILIPAYCFVTSFELFIFGTDPRIRIRIHTKMSWIRNTGFSIQRG